MKCAAHEQMEEQTYVYVSCLSPLCLPPFMFQCSLLMHILRLATVYWWISRSCGHPLVLSSLETEGGVKDR